MKETAGRDWTRASYAYAALVAISLGYFLLRIPIQISDSFTNILALDRPWMALMRDSIQDGYMRPGLWAELKLVFDLSGGNLTAWYRWTHVLQVTAVLLLFVRLLRPRSSTSMLMVPLAIGALVGGHTFAWTVREAFPINTFLTIVLCCVAAANLALDEHRRWHDAAAGILSLVAMLTVESGLLVPGMFMAAYVTGARGISRRGVAGIAGLVAGYFVARYGVFAVGMPGLEMRDAGFGFARRDAAELGRMFGGSPYGFYLYNVVSSIGSVLFAEPREGVWVFTRTLVDGSFNAPLTIGLVSSTLATAVIGRYAWRRRAAWVTRSFNRDDRIVLLFVAVLVANALISCAYTKDVIMSPAGLMFAAALFVAGRDLIEMLKPEMPRMAQVTVVVLVTLLSVGWSVRQVGVHVALANTAAQVRDQWAYIDGWLVGWGYDPPDSRVRALRDRLQSDAILGNAGRVGIREQWTVPFEID